MAKIVTSFSKTASSEAVVETRLLPRFGDSWLLMGDIYRHSERTLGNRRDALRKLVWFLNDREIELCDVHAMRLFFQYVTHGHKEPGGRWGNSHNNRPTSPGTVKTYHSILRAFFVWLIKEGDIVASPMERIEPPVDRPDQIQPFTDAQLLKMLAITKRTNSPRRNEAILLTLLDTGARASELCSLTVRDVDFHGSVLTISEGKGGKSRRAPFSRETKKALYAYLGEREVEDDDPLFLADRGQEAGAALSRHGLCCLIKRICTAAGVDGLRCSPHTFRHTFSISFLRNGGNQFTLMSILGHTSMSMTARYVALSQADIAAQHRSYSPVAKLRGRGGKK